MTAFWEGVIAGLGIAVPVGAIAILIVDMSMRRGFLPGFMAGAATASVDFFFAGFAILAGEMLMRELAKYVEVLRLGSAVVLLSIGCFGIWRALKVIGTHRADPIMVEGHLRIYLKFFVLTFINPMTVTYFGALILGRGVNNVMTTGERIAFIGGAGLASLSWQTFLAGVGTLAGKNLSSRFQRYTSLLGNLVVIGFGLRILLNVLL